MARMTGHYNYDESAWEELIAHLEREGLLEIDIYAGDQPLTDELREKLGFPATAEEALARMRAAKSEQPQSKRKTA